MYASTVGVAAGNEWLIFHENVDISTMVAMSRTGAVQTRRLDCEKWPLREEPP